ncbi:MAG: o-succinylbenzoate synthase [Candidatus Woesebacteria bacterium]
MKSPTITAASLLEVALPLNKPFTTGFGTLYDRNTLLVRLESETGKVGWGEAAILKDPIYLEEWLNGSYQFIQEYLLPVVMKETISSLEFSQKIAGLRRNNISKFAVETALWSLEASESLIPEWKLLGGERAKIQTGASIGMQPSIERTLIEVKEALNQGLTRIKLKIEPGWDFELVRAVREKYPDIMLMVDANSSYTLKDIATLQSLDEFNLIMMEQPLAYDDIIDHAKLAKVLKTPICLDESICSSEDARKAIEIGACKIINVKPARVGSLYEVQRINELARENGIQLWCGGMLESDIGKIPNLACASLSEFSLPADISSWQTYFSSTCTDLDTSYSHGIFTLDDQTGLTTHVDEEWIRRYTVRRVDL